MEYAAYCTNCERQSVVSSPVLEGELVRCPSCGWAAAGPRTDGGEGHLVLVGDAPATEVWLG